MGHIHIPHNTIYKVLLNYGLVEENMKRKRRKWVRESSFNAGRETGK